MNLTLRTKAEIAVSLILLAVIWWEYTPRPAPVGQWQTAPAAAPVNKVPKVALSCKPVTVYAQPAKQKLALPPAVQNDAGKYVLSANQVKPDLHPQTLTTIYDAETGQTDTLVRRDPYPWLAAEQTGSLGLSYGIANGLNRVGRVSFREDLLQIKAIHLDINSTMDTDGQYFIGAGLVYKW